MLVHIWEFLEALYKRSRWFAVLGAASTLSLPFPFLSAHVRWTVAAVALFSFIAANFRLYMDQRREIEELKASAAKEEQSQPPPTTLVLEARQAHFTVSAATDGSVLLYIDCYFDFRNPGSPTTVRLLSTELPGLKTTGMMLVNYLAIGSRHSEREPKLNVLWGESGQLRCHVGIKIERGEWKDARSITIKVMLQETFTAPEIQTYTFAASRQA